MHFWYPVNIVVMTFRGIKLMCFSEASKAANGWRMNGFGELDWGAFSWDYDLLQLVNGAAVTHSSYLFSFLICKGFPDEWKQEKCFTLQFCSNLFRLKVIVLSTSKSVYLSKASFLWIVFLAHFGLFPVWWATGKPNSGRKSGAKMFSKKNSKKVQTANSQTWVLEKNFGEIFWPLY